MEPKPSARALSVTYLNLYRAKKDDSNLINQSIKYTREDLETECPGTPMYSNVRCNLGVRLAIKWTECSSGRTFEDINEALDHLKAAVIDDPHKTAFRTNLKHVLAATEAVAETLQPAEQLPVLRALILLQAELRTSASYKPGAGLATSLVRYYELGGSDVLVLSVAMDMADSEELEEWMPREEIPMCQSDLCYFLRLVHERSGGAHELDRAIVLGERAIAGAGEQDVAKVNLALALGRRFQLRGCMKDLDDAIDGLDGVRKTAVETSFGQEMKLRAQMNMCSFLCVRFEHRGEMSDLRNAIELSTDPIRFAPGGNAKAVRLDTLSRLQARLYEHTKKTSDLTAAIKSSENAVNIAPNHPGLAKHLISLGTWYSWRYDSNRKRRKADLDLALEKLNQALQMLIAGGPDYAIAANNLCMMYRWKYDEDPTQQHINKGIEMGEEALEYTSKEAPTRVRTLRNLGQLMEIRYRTAQDPQQQDLDQAMGYLEEGIYDHNGTLRYRLNIITESLDLIMRYGPSEVALRIAKIGVQLLALVAARSAYRADKQNILKNYAGLASRATALALENGDHEGAAVLLEQGRGIIASHEYEFRTDTAALQEKHPEEALQFQNLVNVLYGDDDSGSGDVESFIPRTSKLHQADRDLEILLRHIRGLHGFSRFLALPEFKDILEVSADSQRTIVMLNVDFRCDAIIITKDSITVVPLPDIQLKTVDDYNAVWWKGGKMERRLENLKQMWISIAVPVLSKLGITNGSDPGLFPSICWIPSRGFCILPLHAAGDYGAATGATLLDCVVSSYSVSVKMLSYTLENKRTSSIKAQSRKALLVSMHELPASRKPSLPALPSAKKEIEALLHSFRNALGPSAVKVVWAPEPSHLFVTSGLDDCTIFHFSGHGHRDFGDPSLSALVLSDKDLTISELKKLRLDRKSTELAYLSACSTGFTASEELVDESIHLMAACQLAGFRNVVGTLWDVVDSISERLAMEFYRQLLEEKLCPARALHYAIQRLRYKVEINEGEGDQQEVTANRTVEDPLLWAAYIHMGI